jgi:hypothetical protein
MSVRARVWRHSARHSRSAYPRPRLACWPVSATNRWLTTPSWWRTPSSPSQAQRKTRTQRGPNRFPFGSVLATPSLRAELQQPQRPADAGRAAVAAVAIVGWRRRPTRPVHDRGWCGVRRPSRFREQRCWFHVSSNVLAALPKSAHLGAKAALAEGPGSRAAGVAMAFKLIESAQARWRAVRLLGRDYSSGIPSSGGALLATTVRCRDEVKELARVEAGRAPLGGGCRSCRIRAVNGCEPSSMRSTTRLKFASGPRHASRAARPRLRLR